MLLRFMSRSPWCTVYHEDNDSAMQAHQRLRDGETIRALIAREPKTVVAFKPLNDAQHAKVHLDLHRRARGIWLYRDYRDVVNSMIQKWGADQLQTYLLIGRGDQEVEASDNPASVDARIYKEGMSSNTQEEVRAAAAAGMTAEDAAALHWYCRNRLFFELGLDRDPRVQLVRYQDLVRDPDQYLQRVFKFAGCRYRPQFAADVFATSVRKRPPPSLSEEITARCDSLLHALHTEYERQLHAD